MPYSRGLAAACLALALLALGVAGTNAAFRTVALVFAMGALMVGATAASQANAIAASLRRYEGGKVSASVWGTSLPIGGSESLILESAFAISAGLHLRLRAESSGRRYRMKVAQPAGFVMDGSQPQIHDARYVMWEGVSLTRMPQVPALVLGLNA